MSRKYWIGIVLIFGVGLAGLFCLAALLHPVRAEMPQAVIMVNTLDDDGLIDGDCSLREAILAASSNVAVDTCLTGSNTITDTIRFSVAGQVNITTQLEGFGGGPMVVDGGGWITIDAGYHSRVISVGSGMNLTLMNLTISHGYVSSATFGNWGGGIRNGGNLKIYRCKISHNKISGISTLGGGIYSISSGLTIQDSTISDNHAYRECVMQICGSAQGGGVFGATKIINSTITGNTAFNAGGGLSNAGVIINSTISGNSVTGYTCYFNCGGGISHASKIVNSTIYNNNHGGINGSPPVVNSIIASNTYGNCSTALDDLGHNIDSGDTCGLNPAKGSMINTNPNLGPLQNNGGPTMTHALLVGSPAIDKGDDANCPSTDQRGNPRPIDGNLDGEAICDIGSYEYIPSGYLIDTITRITGDDPDPSLIGQPFTATFRVTSSIGIPTGIVTIAMEGREESCSGVLDDGVGRCVLALENTGKFTLTAYYSGNNPYKPSSDTESHTVLPVLPTPTPTLTPRASTTTILGSDDPDPSLPGEPFMTSFSVTSTLSTPTGVVTVTVEGSDVICSGILFWGLGSCTLTLASPGEYSLIAAYAGDTQHIPSSTSAAHTVSEPAPELKNWLFLPLIVWSE
jgi:CSLREA domain-containing protein